VVLDQKVTAPHEDGQFWCVRLSLRHLCRTPTCTRESRARSSRSVPVLSNEQSYKKEHYRDTPHCCSREAALPTSLSSLEQHTNSQSIGAPLPDSV
jgi:hypothetical protein